MKHYSRILFNGAVKPALIVGALAAIVALAFSGLSGLKASLLATLIVFIFFAIHLFLAKVTAYLDPKMTFVIMMHSYFLKVIVILLFLVLARNLELDRTVFALVATAVTIAWISGEVKAYWRLGGARGDKR
jgi:type IV secretory pathway TrbD component